MCLSQWLDEENQINFDTAKMTGQIWEYEIGTKTYFLRLMIKT